MPPFSGREASILSWTSAAVVGKLIARTEFFPNMHCRSRLFVVAILISLVALRSAPAVCAEDALEPGLIGEYFAIGEELMDFPNLANDRPANVKRVDRLIHVESTGETFNGTDMTDQFYVRWTGVLKIETAGNYTFFLESDDGSRLFIDGKTVVDNGGPHGMEERNGAVELKPGVHELKVEYFENTGGAGCILRWVAPGKEKQTVPPGVLFHRKGADR
jgi:hypothetical protein